MAEYTYDSQPKMSAVTREISDTIVSNFHQLLYVSAVWERTMWRMSCR